MSKDKDGKGNTCGVLQIEAELKRNLSLTRRAVIWLDLTEA